MVTLELLLEVTCHVTLLLLFDLFSWVLDCLPLEVCLGNRRPRLLSSRSILGVAGAGVGVSGLQGGWL